jgi:hypothetical protein
MRHRLTQMTDEERLAQLDERIAAAPYAGAYVNMLHEERNRILRRLAWAGEEKRRAGRDIKGNDQDGR